MIQDPAALPSRPTHPLVRRSVVLFLNFFLIILAYYQVKSASRSLLIEHWGASSLPYVWIASALVLWAFIAQYNRLVARHSRLHVVVTSCVIFIALLIGFRLMLGWASGAAAVGFYVFVDIFSVILVEQFWSLANSVSRAEEGRKTYWFVGTGGLLGGVVGGALAGTLLNLTPMHTPDLLLSCAAILGITAALNLAMARRGLYEEVRESAPEVTLGGGWRALARSRYLLLIAGVLLCAQFAQPIVEFQFLKVVEDTYSVLDERTAFISWFFSLLGLVSIGINMVLTPLIHRYLGIIAGLLTQPLMLSLFSLGFLAQPSLIMASAMKICDRGLSYSINRASKEQLYIPVDPVTTYQAKAWIDMFGYRVFKVAGSSLILVFTQWLPTPLATNQLSFVTFAVCVVWVGLITMLASEYGTVRLRLSST